jgi:predicted chitinase
MAKKKTYYDYLREELGELIEQLQIDPLQKQSLKRRWLDQVMWADKKADQCRRLHYRLRLTTIIGGVILPALVGVNMQLDKENPFSRWFPYIPFALSQVIAVSAALEEFGRYGDRWRNYRKMTEDLKAEGWQYLQLSGAYEGRTSHKAGYATFASQVENVIKSDVKSYIDALQQKQAKEQEQVEQIVGEASAVAQYETLFARPRPVEVPPPAPQATLLAANAIAADSPAMASAPAIAAGAAGTLKIIQDTTLKLDTLPSKDLPDTYKLGVPNGSAFGLQGQEPAAKNHLKVTLTEKLGAGNYDTWYVYAPHVQIIDGSGAIVPSAPAAPRPMTAAPAVSPTNGSAPAVVVTSNGAIKLPVPYFSQLDNQEQALRTCNTSSCAMVAKFLGANISGDDEYFQKYVTKYGDTTNHGVQGQALEELGIKSTWNVTLDFEDLDKSLATGLPIVIGILHHGPLDAPTGGHMIVVVGRTASGDYLINDPYGDLMTDYQNENGENVIYSRHVLSCRWLESGKANGWGRLFYGNKPAAIASTARPSSASLPPLSPASTPGSAAGLSRITAMLDATATQLLTVDQLMKIAPNASTDRLRLLTPGLNQTFAKYQINTPLRIAHFIAQVAHESDCFNAMEEYASGEDYEGWAELGNTQPGDGKRFKGRGLMQLTGRTNYEDFSKAMGKDFIAQPELVGQSPYAVLVAGWYWDTRKLNGDADKDDVKTITKLINGGYNGLEDRKDYLQRAKSVLNC